MNKHLKLETDSFTPISKVTNDFDEYILKSTINTERSKVFHLSNKFINSDRDQETNLISACLTPRNRKEMFKFKKKKEEENHKPNSIEKRKTFILRRTSTKGNSNSRKSLNNLIDKTNKEEKKEINIPKFKRLDFTKIQEQIDLHLQNENYTPKQIAKTKEKIEELYRDDLIELFKNIDKNIVLRKKIEEEIFQLQKEIDLSKNKLFDLRGGMTNFYHNAGIDYTANNQKYFGQLLLDQKNANKDIKENNFVIQQSERTINNKKIQLENITFIIRELRFKKDVNIRLLCEYYCKLMSVGKDSRDEGLSWILYRLLELGFDINTCQYPIHITKKYFEYLKNIARLKIEREKFKITLNALQSKYKEKFTVKKSKPNLDFLNKNKSGSTNYDKFLTKYFNDKNAAIHFKIHGVEYKVLDYLNSERKKNNNKGNENERGNSQPPSQFRSLSRENGFENEKNGIDTQKFFKQVNYLKTNLENFDKQIKETKKEGIKEFKNDYDDLRVTDYNKYYFIYQCLFGVSRVFS